METGLNFYHNQVDLLFFSWNFDTSAKIIGIIKFIWKSQGPKSQLWGIFYIKKQQQNHGIFYSMRAKLYATSKKKSHLYATSHQWFFDGNNVAKFTELASDIHKQETSISFSALCTSACSQSDCPSCFWNYKILVSITVRVLQCYQ